jgi:hypothetical protein
MVRTADVRLIDKIRPGLGLVWTGELPDGAKVRADCASGPWAA